MNWLGTQRGAEFKRWVYRFKGDDLSLGQVIEETVVDREFFWTPPVEITIEYSNKGRGKRNGAHTQAFADVFGVPCFSEPFNRTAANYLLQNAFIRRKMASRWGLFNRRLTKKN